MHGGVSDDGELPRQRNDVNENRVAIARFVHAEVEEMLLREGHRVLPFLVGNVNANFARGFFLGFGNRRDDPVLVELGKKIFRMHYQLPPAPPPPKLPPPPENPPPPLENPPPPPPPPDQPPPELPHIQPLDAIRPVRRNIVPPAARVTPRAKARKNKNITPMKTNPPNGTPLECRPCATVRPVPLYSPRVARIIASTPALKPAP